MATYTYRYCKYGIEEGVGIGYHTKVTAFPFLRSIFNYKTLAFQ
jgi:hypothetical protein